LDCALDRLRWLLAATCLALVANAVAAEPPAEGTDESLAQAIRAASEALASNPRDAGALAQRARLHAAAGEPRLAVADYDRLLQLDPTRADAYDARGSEQFKLGDVDASIADFDRYLKLRPDQQPWHWKRGISYYYAGQYDAGRRQFEGYQTVDDNDVENAVWRYLCMARDVGVQAARGDMLKIKPDPRVGMMAIYELYGGRAQPADVLAAATAGSPSAEARNARLFYAHLYLGLYFESLGDTDRAREHIVTAAEKHKIGHYMWNVADVHARRLKASQQ
jgi:lipoprotein NlpI